MANNNMEKVWSRNGREQMSQSCLAIVTGVCESAVTHLNSWYMMIGPSSDAEASARAITELRNNDVSSDMSSS